MWGEGSALFQASLRFSLVKITELHDASPPDIRLAHRFATSLNINLKLGVQSSPANCSQLHSLIFCSGDGRSGLPLFGFVPQARPD